MLPRAQTHIPVEMFDGVHFPFSNDSFDAVLFFDVLHHTVDPTILLQEARRVAARHVLIKDHYREGLGANARLRFMDWVGNARFGVALPYNYWTEQQWHAAWLEIGLRPERVMTKLGLYPKPADWVFGAKLHFIALLRPTKLTLPAAWPTFRSNEMGIENGLGEETARTEPWGRGAAQRA